MDEFDGLVDRICASSTDHATRVQCERRLLEILDKNSANWKSYLSELFTCSDTACFFICAGIERLVWKYWSAFQKEDQVRLIM